jgi:hypothetical protein
MTPIPVRQSGAPSNEFPSFLRNYEETPFYDHAAKIEHCLHKADAVRVNLPAARAAGSYGAALGSA